MGSVMFNENSKLAGQSDGETDGGAGEPNDPEAAALG
jgi:hypothetical protein